MSLSAGWERRGWGDGARRCGQSPLGDELIAQTPTKETFRVPKNTPYATWPGPSASSPAIAGSPGQCGPCTSDPQRPQEPRARGAFREPPAVAYSYYVGTDFPAAHIGASSTPHPARLAAMSGFMSIF